MTGSRKSRVLLLALLLLTGCWYRTPAFPGDLNAHCLLAALDAGEGHWPDAALHLRAVVQGDPSFEPPWRELAKALAHVQAHAERAQWAEKYRQAFGREFN